MCTFTYFAVGNVIGQSELVTLVEAMLYWLVQDVSMSNSELHFMKELKQAQIFLNIWMQRMNAIM